MRAILSTLPRIEKSLFFLIDLLLRSEGDFFCFSFFTDIWGQPREESIQGEKMR